ncbi:MAG TPA: peroxiredoxin family protein [Candidatus Binataceae bacterium]|nr:peroxiredoxin family protein [Candidatus Binataceae bacterium]
MSGPAQTRHDDLALELAGTDETYRIMPVFQPLRAIAAVAATAGGFALYEFVLLHFWSSSWLGIHDRIPWPAYLLLAGALVLTLGGVGIALGIWSPHAKLAISMLALLACAAVAVGGGRFVSYLRRGTLDPPFELKLGVGDHFPHFSLIDQHGATHQGPGGEAATLIYVYRGDFCPFARYELSELTALAPELHRDGVEVLAISADPPERSQMLSAYLKTDLPLLSDAREGLLGPSGLVQHHRDGEPDSAIPAFFVVDRTGIIRWIFTSPYYRELPRSETLAAAARSAN